jgi:hypothetical protein
MVIQYCPSKKDTQKMENKIKYRYTENSSPFWGNLSCEVISAKQCK